MCRFLLINRKERFDVEEVLRAFSEMAENSPSPDGDWQGDGWGISWVDPEGNWREFRLFTPIWKNDDFFHIFTPSNTFMIHARSKSFEEDVISEEFNQPYVNSDLSFIFNGEMKGVKIRIDGKNGAEKVFNLFQKFLKPNLEDTATKVRDQLNMAVSNLSASNFVVCNKTEAVVLCNHYEKSTDYHTINYYQDDENILICSQPLKLDFLKEDRWKNMENKQILKFNLFKNLSS